MTAQTGKASIWRSSGSSWTARLAIVCACVLGLAMLAPAAAPATTVFFDNFDSGTFGANWHTFAPTPGVDEGAWWSVFPRGQYVPVASGNYAIGVYTEPGHYPNQTAKLVMGPFQLQGAPYPRLEFDLYRNMTTYVYNGDRPNMSLTITAHRADFTDYKENLLEYRGATGRWEHVVVPLDKWGSRAGLWGYEMQNIADYYSPIYLSFDFENSALLFSGDNPLSYPQPGEGVFIDNVKVAYGAPEVSSVTRIPNKSTISTKRKRNFTLAALVRDSNRGASYGAYSVLQTSKNGRSGWKNTYKMVTNASGIASKTIRPTKKGTTYYRWVVGSKKTSKQKVVVK